MIYLILFIMAGVFAYVSFVVWVVWKGARIMGEIDREAGFCD